MRLPRLYLPAAAPDSEFTLDAAQHRHLIKVLRLRRDEPLCVFDGMGSAYEARIVDEGKAAAAHSFSVIRTTALLAAAPSDEGWEIHIGQGICAAAKMDWAVEKMTELGATSITPLLSEKGKYGAEGANARQRQRWQRLIIAACEQCGRNRLPLLHPPQAVLEWRGGDSGGGDGGSEKKILLTPRAAQPLAAVVAPLRANNTLALAVGGESGFSPDEEESLTAAGFVPASMGARILRSETAALAALAVLGALAALEAAD